MTASITKNEIVAGVVIALLFLGAAYISETNKDLLQELIGDKGIWGPLLYVGITIIAVVVAPVSALPILPVAVVLWGSFAAALLSLVGWVIGAVVAFVLARTYGYAFVRKFILLRKIQEYSDRIPRRNIFWSIVFLRIVMPVDILSYALGLFSQIPLLQYTFATIIGLAPFAFVFSYAAALSIGYRIGAIILAGLFIIFGYRKVKHDIDIGIGDTGNQA